MNSSSTNVARKKYKSSSNNYGSQLLKEHYDVFKYNEVPIVSSKDESHSLVDSFRAGGIPFVIKVRSVYAS